MSEILTSANLLNEAITRYPGCMRAGEANVYVVHVKQIGLEYEQQEKNIWQK
jgi:hypothetical protein